MPTSLGELGLAPTTEEIKIMAALCAQAAGGQLGSARILREEDIRAIYEMAR